MHLAHDQVLGRTVAVKRIGMMPGNESAELERAEREARLAAALNHPHVVSVFDLVEEDDVRWLVMEFVDGRTISDLVRESGPMEATEAAALLAQTADALVEAHAGGIVHRDVKPSNILIADGVAKLGDFGIARSTNDPSLTQTGLVTGSPAYLAPEVASGASATAASDVWSLGATLFHAVSGRPPYDVGENLIGALYKIVHEDPPRLPAGHQLAGLLSVMMQRDPERRWPMTSVRDELRRIAQGRPGTVTAPAAPSSAVPPREDTGVLPPAPPVTPAPTPRAARHHRRWGWVVAAVVAVVAVAVTAYVLAGRSTPEAADDPAGQQSAQEAPTSPDPTTTSPPLSAEDTQEQMDAFIASYLSTATSDPRAAFDQLTPEFQDRSDGYDGYVGWWGNVRSASLAGIQSNPADLTVSYTVDYVMKSGERTSERVRLQLQRQDDRYLIAGES